MYMTVLGEPWCETVGGASAPHEEVWVFPPRLFFSLYFADCQSVFTSLIALDAIQQRCPVRGTSNAEKGSAFYWLAKLIINQKEKGRIVFKVFKEIKEWETIVRAKRDKNTASFFLGEIKEIKQMRLKRVASLIKSPKEWWLLLFLGF